MLRSVRDLRGYALRVADHEPGAGPAAPSVADVLLDDERWVVRWIVVGTGGWLGERQTLISPMAIRAVHWEDRTIDVGLTRSQVEGSPPLERHLPVSRRHERDLHHYYGWPFYWGGVGAWGAVLTPGALAVEPPPAPEEPTAPGEAPGPGAAEDEVRLHSAEEVIGYHVRARDDEVGHVEDLLVDDETWAIRSLVVDTRNWLPGRRVLIAPTSIERFSWSERRAVATLSRAEIESAPEFDESAPVNCRLEEQHYDVYGRPAQHER